MRSAIILHGRPSKAECYDGNIPSASNDHWYPWLQKQLLTHDIYAQTPEVPDPWRPEWDKWRREVERFDIGPETILVGHSTGAGFFVKYLSINPKLRVGKVVLVAPYLDPHHTIEAPFFRDFEIDPAVAERTAGLWVFESDNDQDDVKVTVDTLRSKLTGAKYRTFHDYGHFCLSDMKTVEFPELLAEIVT